jgi:hypothetical protein
LTRQFYFTAASAAKGANVYQTKVITEERQVPAGYISMSAVREQHGETVAKKLSDAHKAGQVPAVKLMRTINDKSGMVWVDMRAWKDWLQAREQKAAPKFQGTRDKNESPWDELVSMSFAVQSMDSSIARVAEALESLLQVQTQMLASMQRLETAWAAGERSS